MKPFKSVANPRKKISFSFADAQRNFDSERVSTYAKEYESCDGPKPLPASKIRQGVGLSTNCTEKGKDDKNQSGKSTVPTVLGKLPSLAVYMQQLTAKKSYYSLRRRCLAMSDCNEDGVLTKSFVVLESLLFSEDSSDHSEEFKLFICSCDRACNQRELLQSINRAIGANASEFKEKTENNYCIHAEAASNLELFRMIDNSSEDETEDEIDQISLEPFLVGVHDGNTYGIITTEPFSKTKRLRCCTCKTNVHLCCHIQQYRGWCDANEIEWEMHVEEDNVNNDEFVCYTYCSIPYPLPPHLKDIYDQYECGNRVFPEHLIPAIPEADKKSVCEHGNKWDARDPIKKGWILNDNVKIVKGSTVSQTLSSFPRKSYYRPTLAKCGCKLFYDGQDDLLFNLDNKYFFYYGFLFQYLHLMIEGRNPLAAFHRANNRSVYALSQSSPVSYDIFRRAWNSFARLLDINWKECFHCPICGVKPSTIICDGTFLGFRKDFILPFMSSESTFSSKIRGTTVKERILIKDPSTRSLLQKYSGMTISKGNRGIRKTIFTNGLTSKEFSLLICGLKKAVPCLADIITRINQNYKKRCRAPAHYQQLLHEISLSTPTVGIAQIGGDERAQEILKKIGRMELNPFHASSNEELMYIQSNAPLILKFIKEIHDAEGEIPIDFGKLLCAIVDNIKKTFEGTTSNEYPAVNENKLSFFPILPQRHGSGLYKADKKKDGTYCRKESYKHPKLTPGIFTIFCSHGICYGFEAMTSCESPKVPFNIFLTRFETAPEIIVYDNCCNLHRYCLNREPKFFQSTKFYVDKFHWKFHIACSEGYSLDHYKCSFDISQINSQINEQANAGLKRLKSQLAYMKVDNFMFHISLFLSIKNKDKICALVSRNIPCDEIQKLSLS